MQRVSCKGTARFTWIEGDGKDQSWNERFLYVLDFDDEAKVASYQVWADSGAAYLARTGQLNALRKVDTLLMSLFSTEADAWFRPTMKRKSSDWVTYIRLRLYTRAAMNEIDISSSDPILQVQ